MIFAGVLYVSLALRYIKEPVRNTLKTRFVKEKKLEKKLPMLPSPIGTNWLTGMKIFRCF